MNSRLPMTVMATLLFSTVLWGVDASFAGPPEWPECVTSGLTQGVVGVKIVNGVPYFVRRLAIVFNEAIADFGASAVDDSLEIFCVSRKSSDRFGKIAMCLTGEKCPWRESSDDDAKPEAPHESQDEVKPQ
jgi:hypothetical protein